MRQNRFIVTSLTVAALVLAVACRSSRTTKTSSTTSTTSVTTTPAVASSSTVAPTVYTDNNGTTVVDNGTTKTTTTTTIYRNGQVVTDTSGNNTMASSTANGTTTTTVPGGAAVVVTTTTTTKSTPAVVTQTPMASATQTQTTYGQTIFGHRRRYPNLDFLAFADRASFSNNNRSLNGTINTGELGTSIRHENGWGVGFNAYVTPNVSTEFTASRIRPTATLAPTNATFNPITDFRIRMTPITGAVQFHFLPHAGIDPYIGGGGEYVMFHADNGFNPGTTGLTSVRFRDEWGWMVNGGLRFGNARGVSFNVDGKYSWVRARAETTFDSTTLGNVGNGRRIGLNPLILSAGVRFGF